MCGILGLIQKDPVDQQGFKLMLDKIKHRGPEQEGLWFNSRQNVALGHRRLAIIDLSPLGSQPMKSEDGRYIIVFNGEIYNFEEIRNELSGKGHKFISKSDTEVLLKSYIQWGAECLEKLNGMFAFAIWDQKEEVLFAARDRLGEKPFKYFFDGTRFVFGSELKALLGFSFVKKDVDWNAVDLALGLRFVPSPRTGFKSIFKLPAGHFLILKSNQLKIQRYWSIDAIEVDSTKSQSEWQEELSELFEDSVKKRLISDVPVGAFLSGGVDSTSVVAMASRNKKEPIDTFVISMDGESEDKKYARLAAKHFKTNHHEIQLDEINYAESVRDLVGLYDEPFFDQSALPSMLISREMKKHVTVVLSGDGADELFGGYRSFKFVKFLKLYQTLPSSVRKFVPQFFRSFSNGAAYKAEILAKDFFNAYAEYYSVWKNNLPISKRYLTKRDLYSEHLSNEIDENLLANQFKGWFNNYPDVVSGAMLADVMGILPDGYLTKIDLAAMGSALEVRPPFLDYRLVELSRKIPSGLKIKNGVGKYIWKELMRSVIPEEILTRPKAGFVIPLDRIIKNQLKPMITDILLDKNSKIYNNFKYQTVEKMWQVHLNGKADYSNHLWSLLILELWLREYQK